MSNVEKYKESLQTLTSLVVNDIMSALKKKGVDRYEIKITLPFTDDYTTIISAVNSNCKAEVTDCYSTDECWLENMDIDNLLLILKDIEL
jgi:hypothetical protein